MLSNHSQECSHPHMCVFGCVLPCVLSHHCAPPGQVPSYVCVLTLTCLFSCVFSRRCTCVFTVHVLSYLSSCLGSLVKRTWLADAISLLASLWSGGARVDPAPLQKATLAVTIRICTHFPSSSSQQKAAFVTPFPDFGRLRQVQPAAWMSSEHVARVSSF